jgi:hypothetical protein
VQLDPAQADAFAECITQEIELRYSHKEEQ